jgi:hypothetical protein
MYTLIWGMSLRIGSAAILINALWLYPRRPMEESYSFQKLKTIFSLMYEVHIYKAIQTYCF